MEFTKKESFTKQIALYLNNKDYENAYAISKEFASKFSNELTAHFLLAKSAFWAKRFDEAVVAGRNAFNLASGQTDMITCAVLLSTAYYMLGDYGHCYELLNELDATNNADVEKLMFLLALAANNEKEAAKRVANLYSINRRVAEDFVMKFF